MRRSRDPGQHVVVLDVVSERAARFVTGPTLVGPVFVNFKCGRCCPDFVCHFQGPCVSRLFVCDNLIVAPKFDNEINFPSAGTEYHTHDSCSGNRSCGSVSVRADLPQPPRGSCRRPLMFNDIVLSGRIRGA